MEIKAFSASERSSSSSDIKNLISSSRILILGWELLCRNYVGALELLRSCKAFWAESVSTTFSLASVWTLSRAFAAFWDSIYLLKAFPINPCANSLNSPKFSHGKDSKPFLNNYASVLFLASPYFFSISSLLTLGLASGSLVCG